MKYGQKKGKNYNLKKMWIIIFKVVIEKSFTLVKTNVVLKYIDENLMSMIAIHIYIKYHTNFVSTNTNNLEHT
jgi:hypothetical protein